MTDKTRRDAVPAAPKNSKFVTEFEIAALDYLAKTVKDVHYAQDDVENSLRHPGPITHTQLLSKMLQASQRVDALVDSANYTGLSARIGVDLFRRVQKGERLNEEDFAAEGISVLQRS